jgi:hypothetical protein
MGENKLGIVVSAWYMNFCIIMRCPSSLLFLPLLKVLPLLEVHLSKETTTNWHLLETAQVLKTPTSDMIRQLLK